MKTRNEPPWFAIAVRFDVWMRGPHPFWRRVGQVLSWVDAFSR